MTSNRRQAVYRYLQSHASEILVECGRAGPAVGATPELRGRIGLATGVSAYPPPVEQYVIDAMVQAAGHIRTMASLVDELRERVRAYYGDEYDACPVNTAESALWMTFDVLCAPPFQGRGDNYRGRYVVPYERHLDHHGAYGRPFPPAYRDIFADRGSTAGELSFSGKRHANLETMVVPLAGARYERHGIKHWPVPLLLHVEAEASAARLARAMERCGPFLVAVSSLGYDTPGYGYGEKTEDGVPVLQRRLGELARSFQVPYIVDNAWGLPFLGTDPRRIGADVIIFSMDKAARGITSGLIVGREEAIVPLQRALGIHGERWGTGVSYGKGAYVVFDPGKVALAVQVAVLKDLQERQRRWHRLVDDLEAVVREELPRLHPDIRAGLSVYKSYNSCFIELNYEDTWKDGRVGVPIFSSEDGSAGTNLIMAGQAAMGIQPTIAYDANVPISPGMGTLTPDGQLDVDRMRVAVRGLFEVLNIVYGWGQKAVSP